MQLDIINEKQNPLFNRKEIQLSTDLEIIPKKTEVEKSISEKFSIKPETIKIKNILGKFGSKQFTITANIYKSKEDLEKIEPNKKNTEVQEPAPTQGQPISEVQEQSAPTEQKTPESKENKSEQPEEPKAEEQNTKETKQEKE